MSQQQSIFDESPSAAPAAPAMNIWPMFQRRWPFIFLGLIVGTGIGVLMYVTAVPVYQSSAQVLIVKKRTELIKEGDMRIGSVEDYIATQLTLIKSEKIRMAAAQQARAMQFSLPLPADDRAVAGMIGAGLSISRDKDATTGSSLVGSGVLNLSMQGGNPEDCRKLLQAVILAHQSELFKIYDQASQDKISTLDKLANAVKEQREKAGGAKLAALGKLREITSEEVAGIRARVTSNRTQQGAYKSELVDLEDQLQLIAKTEPNPQDRQLTLAQLTAQLRPIGSTGIVPAEVAKSVSIIRELELQRRDLAQAVGLGKDHPRILAIDSQISTIKEEMAKPVPKGEVALDELGAYKKWAEQKKKTTERQFIEIGKQLRSDEATLKEAGVLQDQIEALSTSLLQQDAEIKRLEAEKMNTEATQGAGGYSLEQITPPATGGKTAPVLFRSLATGIMIGLVFGIGMMFFAEFRDKSFRSPIEIRQRLGVPVIGHIPFITPINAGIGGALSQLDPVLVTAHRPKSPEAETYRGLRTQLFFCTQGRGHPVIQVTSPTPGDGKSTSAANLAISVAQSGKRTILVDCDFRKPRVHKLFGLEPEHGLAGFIAGIESLESGIVASGVPNLDILPCGTRPANPAELLSSPQFQGVLDQLRERYDFVIVDTPPILAVTDPAIVAPRVDGVIIVFRMSKKVRPAAERAREVLAGVGAHTIGVVVNAADRRLNAYNYGYSYGAGYGYKYTDYKYSESYHDDELAHERG